MFDSFHMGETHKPVSMKINSNKEMFFQKYSINTKIFLKFHSSSPVASHRLIVI